MNALSSPCPVPCCLVTFLTKRLGGRYLEEEEKVILKAKWEVFRKSKLAAIVSFSGKKGLFHNLEEMKLLHVVIYASCDLAISVVGKSIHNSYRK